MTKSSFVRFLLVLLFLLPFSTSQAHTHFEFSVETKNPRVFEELRRDADVIYLNLAKRLGSEKVVRKNPPIQVTISSNREAFRQAQPGQVDHWAAGTAYPAQGLIFLSTDAHDFFTKEEVAVHEIAHIVVYRAAGKRRLPRWFEEGIAIYLADEDLVRRFQSAQGAALSERVPSLQDLTRSFPRPAGEARLAYAVGSLFVQHLVVHYQFDQKMGAFFQALRDGLPFPRAIEKTLGTPLPAIEEEWRDNLHSSASWLATLSDGEWIWFGVSLLFLIVGIVGFIRKNRNLAQMEDGNPWEPDEDDVWPPTGMPGV